MRGWALGVVLILVACGAPPTSIAPTPTPTLEPGALTVVAFLDLSGPHAALGTGQRNALTLWTDDHRGVKLRVVDVGDSDTRLLLELRRAATEEPASAAIIGTGVSWDDTLGRAIELAGMPVLFTLPLSADPAPRIGGRWGFALAPTQPRLAAWEIDDAMRRNTLTPSLVLTLPVDRVDPLAAALDAEIAKRGLAPITHVPLPADDSVPPVVRSSLTVLRSVHCTATPSACAAVAEAARSSGAPTVLYLPYATAPSEVSGHGDLAARAMWPASTWTLPFDSPPVTAANQTRDRFLRAYGERWGAASTAAATAHDALSLLASAADRASPDDRSGLRDALERITMPLIAGTYAFGPGRHAGMDATDLAYVRWTGNGLAPALAASRGTGISTPRTTP